MRKDMVKVASQAAAQEETDFVEEYWTRIWECHPAGADPLRQVRRKEEFGVLMQQLAGLPRGARILDGGCGWGQWTVYLTRQGYDAYGIDISKAVIKCLGERFQGVHFAVEDIRRTSFEDGYFDAYFSWGTFEHFEEGLDQCFREARRILKAGGVLCISVPFYNARHLRRDAAAGGKTAPEGERFYQWRLTQEELRQAFERNGFSCRLVKPMHKGEGVRRMVHHDYGVPYESRWHPVLTRLLQPWCAGTDVCHMLLAAGVKR